MKKLRFIIIGDFRKKILIFLAAAAFWILMFFTASNLVQNCSEINISSNSLAGLSTYESKEGGFSVSYPSSFTLTPQSFTGKDILFHIDFHSREGTEFGFIQIWKMAMPVKKFLENSKQASQLKYKYFSSKTIKAGGFTGFYWDYSVQGSNNKFFKGNEVFLQGKDQMYRISYIMPEDKWNEYQNKIFFNIVNSFKKY